MIRDIIMTVKPNNGFTLIELMITITIIGILSSIAVPYYFDYVTRTYRSDAYKALVRMAGLQERYYLQNHTYADTALKLLYEDSDEGLYEMSVDASDGSGYTLKATAKIGSPVENDTLCKEITYNQAQVKLPVNCWEQ